MHRQTDLTYVYDGSYDGALCCIFQAFLHKERPFAICPETELQPTLCPVRYIETCPQQAERVALALKPKISARAEAAVQHLFWTCQPEKELLMLDFVRLGFRYGGKVTAMLGDQTVAQVAEAIKHLRREAHNYKGFLRFSAYGPVLVGVIEPKNFVLPILAPHFAARYRNEAFLIWDKTHKAACSCIKGESQIGRLEGLILPQPDTAEEQTRRLFRRYFDTIAIEARKNPRCQMTHLPLRYRSQMTEFVQDEQSAVLLEEEKPQQNLLTLQEK